MNVKMECYQGAELLAANEASILQAAPPVRDIDPRVLLTLDVSLFRCLKALDTSRDRICSALLLSNAEYDYISEMI